MQPHRSGECRTSEQRRLLGTQHVPLMIVSSFSPHISVCDKLAAYHLREAAACVG
jgi:hypothetical protein